MKELDIRGTIGYVNNHKDTIKLVEDGLVEPTKPAGMVVIVLIWSHPAEISVHSVVIKDFNNIWLGVWRA